MDVPTEIAPEKRIVRIADGPSDNDTRFHLINGPAPGVTGLEVRSAAGKMMVVVGLPLRLL